MSHDQKPAYRTPISPLWFLSRRVYTLFFLREMSSVFIGVFCISYLYLLYSLGQGEAAYTAALAWVSSPLMVAFHVVALGFILYHTYTFFQMNAQILQKFRGMKTPPALILGSSYAGVVLVSAVVGWLLIG